MEDENRPETVFLDPIPGGYNLTIQDDLSGSAVGISISKNAYSLLGEHFLEKFKTKTE